MSLLQTIIFHVIKHRRKPYDPLNPPDYVKKRIQEETGIPQCLPKGIQCREIDLDGIHGECLFSDISSHDKCVLYIHGGSFVTGSTKTVRPLTCELVTQLECPVNSIRYRLAPEHPFPAAPEDCFTAYRALEKRLTGKNIILIGESAGGTLALATVLRAKNEGLSLPACVIALAPAVQFDQEFPSYYDNLETDCMVSNLCQEVKDTYLQSEDPAVLQNPYAAPYYGDFNGFPPTLLIASDSEVLRDDSKALYEKLQKAGVQCRLRLFHNMMHIFPVVPSLPESKEAYREIRQFVAAAIKEKK